VFYETLAAYYDQIFPAAQATVSFLDRNYSASGVKTILDLACGTGTYSLALARLGYYVLGTDLEPGMVDAARQKAEEEQLDVRFTVADMRDADKLGEAFDGLFCVGNSLAHLLDENDLTQALQAMCTALKEGGTAILQIVNFDHILVLGDTELPLIENENLRFVRIYRPQSEERLVFDSVLEIKKENGVKERLENSVTLRPIRKAQLEKYLLDAGFVGVKIYGNFKEEPYTQSAQAIVAVAKK
jgi:SAM-dependent methyltransferase